MSFSPTARSPEAAKHILGTYSPTVDPQLEIIRQNLLAGGCERVSPDTISQRRAQDLLPRGTYRPDETVDSDCPPLFPQIPEWDRGVRRTDYDNIPTVLSAETPRRDPQPRQQHIAPIGTFQLDSQEPLSDPVELDFIARAVSILSDERLAYLLIVIASEQDSLSDALHFLAGLSSGNDNRSYAATLLKRIKNTLVSAGYVEDFDHLGDPFKKEIEPTLLGERYAPLGAALLGYSAKLPDSIRAYFPMDKYDLDITRDTSTIPRIRALGRIALPEELISTYSDGGAPGSVRKLMGVLYRQKTVIPIPTSPLNNIDPAKMPQYRLPPLMMPRQNDDAYMSQLLEIMEGLDSRIVDPLSLLLENEALMAIGEGLRSVERQNISIAQLMRAFAQLEKAGRVSEIRPNTLVGRNVTLVDDASRQLLLELFGILDGCSRHTSDFTIRSARAAAMVLRGEDLGVDRADVETTLRKAYVVR